MAARPAGSRNPGGASGRRIPRQKAFLLYCLNGSMANNHPRNSNSVKNSDETRNAGLTKDTVESVTRRSPPTTQRKRTQNRLQESVPRQNKANPVEKRTDAATA